MIYNYILLDPSNSAEARERNYTLFVRHTGHRTRHIHHVPTFGIGLPEVWAELCSLGNLTATTRGLAEAALDCPLPRRAATLAIWPSDDPHEMLDRIAAAAVLSIRAEDSGNFNGFDQRVQTIAQAVAARRGPWKPRPLPERGNEWPEPGERDLALLLLVHTLGTIDAKVGCVREWLLTGALYGEKAEEQIDEDRRAPVEALERGEILTGIFDRGGHVRLTGNAIRERWNQIVTHVHPLLLKDRVAVVEPSHPDSIELGFRLAPVVIHETGPYPESDLEEEDRILKKRYPRHVTIAVWPGHWKNDCDIDIWDRLNELEPIWYNKVDPRRRPFDEIEGYDLDREEGWTIQGNRILSPLNRPTELTVEQVLEIIREVTE